MKTSAFFVRAITTLILFAPGIEAKEITLAAVPGRVAQANPDLAAARLMVEEARGRQLGAGR